MFDDEMCRRIDEAVDRMKAEKDLERWDSGNDRQAGTEDPKQ